MSQYNLDRVCIVMMSAVGDSVHVLPVINAIKREHPSSRITWVLQPGPASLVRGHPAVDDIIIFDRLTEEELKKIVKIQLKRLVRRLENQKITLELTDAAKAFVAQHGYDPVYGARPLKRAIQKYILDPLSMDILEGKFREGQRIKVDAENENLKFIAK